MNSRKWRAFCRYRGGSGLFIILNAAREKVKWLVCVILGARNLSGLLFLFCEVKK